jgi:protein O-mannosyl-transferase
MSLAAWKPLAGIAFLVAGSAAAWKWRKQFPGAAVGWVWYIVTLAPMSGVIQAGPQAGADRYSYVPAIGLMLIVISLAPRIRVAGLVIAGALAALTVVQIGHWKNSITLFEHSTRVTRDNWISMRNLGGAYIAAGRTADGIAQFKASLALAGKQPETNYQLGSAIAATGDWAGAFPYFDAAVKLTPDYGSAEYARGTALAHTGRNAEAKQSLQRALTLAIDSSFKAEAHNTLGVIAINEGDRATAEQHFRTAIAFNPSLEIARRNLQALGAIRQD